MVCTSGFPQITETWRTYAFQRACSLKTLLRKERDDLSIVVIVFVCM